MKKYKILHTEAKDYCHESRVILDSCGQVDYFDIGRAGILERIADYDVLIVRLRNKVDKGILEKGKRLKFIATATTGTNHIDEKLASQKGIRVVSLKGETRFLSGVYSTAEHTVGLMLALLRFIPAACKDVTGGSWQNEIFRGHELHGKCLGIIGYGRLGKMVAKIALSFGMKVFAYDTDKTVYFPQGVHKVALDSLLAQADIVTIHIPLNKGNENFMNQSKLKKLKEGAYLINTSRGDVLDEKALLTLLKRKHLAGTALDVLKGEEKPGFRLKTNALVQYAQKNNNLIITPHIGGAAIEAVNKTDVFIARKLKGELLRYVKK